jgi:3-hydroxymyristoyl/3-hydroxydecanoyl-(acyl carrier protein) dehydratase
MSLSSRIRKIAATSQRGRGLVQRSEECRSGVSRRCVQRVRVVRSGQLAGAAVTAVPNWLEERPGTPVRDVRVATGASGELDLLDRMEVVDGGGRHGAGYLRATRPVAATDWYFARHFHLDPVMPGSLGVEAVIQALQAWLIDTGAPAGLTDPEFVVPAGAELVWRYRGQILARDGELTLEVHIRTVERRPGRIRVLADASLWRPGLRIYELDGIAAEARDKGAPS